MPRLGRVRADGYYRRAGAGAKKRAQRGGWRAREDVAPSRAPSRRRDGTRTRREANTKGESDGGWLGRHGGEVVRPRGRRETANGGA